MSLLAVEREIRQNEENSRQTSHHSFCTMHLDEAIMMMTARMMMMMMIPLFRCGKYDDNDDDE